jgi:hypothetical protein
MMAALRHKQTGLIYHSGRGASHLTILSKTAALLDVPVEVAVDLADHGWTVDGVTFTLGRALTRLGELRRHVAIRGD